MMRASAPVLHPPCYPPPRHTHTHTHTSSSCRAHMPACLSLVLAELRLLLPVSPDTHPRAAQRVQTCSTLLHVWQPDVQRRQVRSLQLLTREPRCRAAPALRAH